MSELSPMKGKYISNANIVFKMFRNKLVMLNAGHFKRFLERCHLVHLRGQRWGISVPGGAVAMEEQKLYWDNPKAYCH